MVFLYTARGIFYRTSEENGTYCTNYIKWSKLSHLTELVSLDELLNEVLVEPDYNNSEDLKYIHFENGPQTSYFTTQSFVIRRMKEDSRFNLLALVIEPAQDCKAVDLKHYEFMGYDLIDQYFNISALVNCRDFDETFQPGDLNEKGLIDDYAKAYEIKKQLLENNPGEDHADTNVIAIWRHRTIGR